MQRSELVQLGEVLKERRKEKNFSLKEVENATSIRMNYLQAIEEGDIGKLISPIYAHGFINKYAQFLEMDAEELIHEYPTVMQFLVEKKVPTEEFSFGMNSLEVRGSPGKEVKWLPNLMWVALSVVGILSFWFLAQYLGLF